MNEWLQKFLQRNMEISRRKAVELIRSKIVKVNGETIDDLGTKVSDTDSVEVDGKLIKNKSHRLIYIILNKPKRYITSLQDPQGRKTIADIFKGKINERIFPVGRLDYLTTGLLILTNDGDFYQAIIHPRFSKAKVYRALVLGKVTKQDIKDFSNMVLDGKLIKGSKLVLLREFRENALVEITIYQGLNRQVRRMLEKINKKTLYLKRIKVGPFTLDKDLKEGEWRFFNNKEMLLMKEIKDAMEKYRKRT